MKNIKEMRKERKGDFDMKYVETGEKKRKKRQLQNRDNSNKHYSSRRKNRKGHSRQCCM